MSGLPGSLHANRHSFDLGAIKDNCEGTKGSPLCYLEFSKILNGL